MSFVPCEGPDTNRHDRNEACAVEAVIAPRERDLGGFTVRRVLPAAERRAVGSFVFFDQMGPSQFAPGQGINVRPHPHIGLATITYLFEGEIFHRDSLGSALSIRPGEVNWMTAGRGIVHSERTTEKLLAEGQKLYGIQAWVALPKDKEETEPAFVHHAQDELPVIESPGVRVHLIAGSLLGASSPVKTASRLFYAAVDMQADATLGFAPEHEERAVYLLEGALMVDNQEFEAGRLLTLRAGQTAHLKAASPVKAMLLGGAPLDGHRHIWWNFVSSSKERMAEAKSAWRHRAFPTVPGDEEERIPLPE